MRPPDPNVAAPPRAALAGATASVERTIAGLVADLRPVARHAAVRRLLAGAGVGVVASIILVDLVLGYRPDMVGAALTAMFWIKFAYALALAGLALWTVDRLARPGVSAMSRSFWLLAPVAVLTILAIWQLADAPATDRRHMLMGVSAAACPWRIVGFALPPLAGLLWAVRGLAPTHLAHAGAIAGIAAGGLGAAAYALNCQEATGPFVAAWYSLGVLAVGGLGATLGARVLRW
ncbi:DUF1109 domain-containing protein [Caulobacter sp. 602-1]|uniref:DUF1109 domain-containing protein n=1 Tax=Caulobacter sp. 602-1 TaxID=2492472 RepID=UPI0013157F82|nr:DUF1109 domain-containing protein [Caulobacter sp. 602-1]